MDGYLLAVVISIVSAYESLPFKNAPDRNFTLHDKLTVGKIER